MFSRAIASSRRKADMSEPASKSARAVAAEVLHRFDAGGVHAGPLLDRLLPQTDQKQRATDLVFGTIRNLLAIDRVIEQFSGRPVRRIDESLRAIIRVGVYELAYSPDTPVYSIVDEAVKIAGHAGGRRQMGFVNAVLRGIVRHIAARQTPVREASAARMLVQSPQAGCEFDTDFLPDATSYPAAYLSECFSIPRWLVEGWITEFGPQGARAICLGSNRRPSVYVRVNTLKTRPGHLVEHFREVGIDAEVVAAANGSSQADMVRLLGPQAISRLPGYAEGWFTVQDPAAARAVCLLNPQPGWAILDLCAAPGTKTTQLAEWTRDDARIVATDADAERLKNVTENVARLGCNSVTVVPCTPAEWGRHGPFDAILLDVPCSNTGVLARRIEVRHRVRPASVAQLAGRQLALLAQAAALLKEHGRICYSTCSIESAEDGDLVRRFLAADSRFTLVHEELALPSAAPFDHDGAYVAILQRL